MTSQPTASFLDYAPVSLAFGTSGLRGLVEDITDLEAYINVKAALRYLLANGDIAAGSQVAVAGDLRPSSERIMRASMMSIVDLDCQVEYAGKIPTPALIHHSISTKRAGVMVTGSHIPFDRNGIKVNRSRGEILKTDEPGILHQVEAVRAEEYAKTAHDSPFDANGMAKREVALPAIDDHAQEAYVRRYLDAFAHDGLRAMRILFYQHSAVGRDLLPRILRGLGCDVVTAGRSETFVALDTENVTDEQLDRLEALLAEAEANGPSHATFAAIVSTDGDSDRPLICAVVPKDQRRTGKRHVAFLPGDLLGIVVAEYLSADAAAVPISANDAVERRMRERGVFFQTTKIGSPYVVSAIDDLCRAGKYSRIVGWEANGGFLCGSSLGLSAGTLAALPTRDATLPIVANLFSAAQQDIGLSVLWSRLPARFGRSGLLDEVPTTMSQALIKRLTPAAGASDGEPAIAAMLSRVFTPALGFDDVVSIDRLDGIRIHFANGDVAHVRPSGNAPQLRIYANSDSQERADRIVAEGLREPDGILRTLLRLSADPSSMPAEDREKAHR